MGIKGKSMLSRKVISWSIRLLLALLIGLTSVAFLPLPADAAEIDLELGGAGATSWNITCIAPGDNGTQTVYLQNVGTRNGFVTIWISNITEVDKDYGVNDPNATLGKYLLFNITCNRLSTTKSLPTTIHNLPQYAGDKSLKITPLNAGDNVTLVWEWQFPETGGQQNEAQGDSLSFTINYMLEEFHGKGSGGGGGPRYPHYRWLEIDLLGEVTRVKVNSLGKLLEPVSITDESGRVTLELDRGSKILCPGKKVPQRLEIEAIQIPPPEGMTVLGQAYRLDAYLYKYSQRPSLFTISPPGGLVLSYELSELPPNSLSVFTAYYDDTRKDWMELSPGNVTEAGELTVEISGPLICTIMVKLGPPPSPAESCFRPSNLVIEPGEAKPGQEITISLIVTNIGGAPGTCTLELKVDGEVRSVKSVDLNPGESEVLSFSIIEGREGEHIVKIADLRGDFSIVMIFRPWWLLGTAGVVPMIIILERRRRWQLRVNWGTGLKTKDWIIK